MAHIRPASAGARKVVLATSITETKLTIDGDTRGGDRPAWRGVRASIQVAAVTAWDQRILRASASPQRAKPAQGA